MAPPTIVAFSHLRWEVGFERPQQVLSRLARDARVLFVEEPRHADAAPHWQLAEAHPNVLVCRPHTPLETFGLDAVQLPVLIPMLEALVARQRVREPIAWTSTPMALPIVRALEPRAIVYDCTEEPAARGPDGWERALLAAADVVFCDGPRLHAAVAALHPHVHCLPSGADAAHFRRDAATIAEPPEQAALRRPRLGFFGLLDAPLDGALLDAVARARPAWELVLVGATRNGDVPALAARPNVHVLGPRPWDALPAYVGGWDSCILPLAPGETPASTALATVRALLATERPVVSTPLPAVAEAYGEVVYVGDGAAGFVAACERAMGAGRSERAARTRRARAALAGASWDVTVGAMARLVEQAVQRRRASRAA